MPESSAPLELHSELLGASGLICSTSLFLSRESDLVVPLFSYSSLSAAGLRWSSLSDWDGIILTACLELYSGATSRDSDGKK